MAFMTLSIRQRFFGLAGGMALMASGTALALDFSDFKRHQGFVITGPDVAEITTHFAGEDGGAGSTVKTIFDYGAKTYCRNAVCASFGPEVEMVGGAEKFFQMIHEEACRQAAFQMAVNSPWTLTDKNGTVLEVFPENNAYRHGKAFFEKHCFTPVS